MKAEDLTEEEIFEKYEHYLTFKMLQKFVEENKDNIHPDAKIIVERVEDKYFERNGWKTLKLEGDFYRGLERTNESIRKGLCEAKEEIPQEYMDDTKEEFHPAWYIAKHSDKIVLIYMHY